MDKLLTLDRIRSLHRRESFSSKVESDTRETYLSAIVRVVAENAAALLRDQTSPLMLVSLPFPAFAPL